MWPRGHGHCDSGTPKESVGFSWVWDPVGRTMEAETGARSPRRGVVLAQMSEANVEFKWRRVTLG